MQPLTKKQKDFFYRELAFGRFRWIARPAYEALVGLELLWHRIEDFFQDLFHGRDKSDVSEVTAIIKTFERPYAVKRLVRSIKRRYPDLKIIVVDDSRETVSMEGVKMIRMPYNTGISIGRNRALDETESRYFLLLDDDFVFSRRQKIGEWVDFMESHPQVDILGGRCIDLPLYIEHDFHDMPLFRSDQTPKIEPGTRLDYHGPDRYVVANKVQNFFLGRTETVREVKWKPELKTMEHTDFFTRACGRLTTVYHSGMRILHAKTPFDIEYLKVRFGVR